MCVFVHGFDAYFYVEKPRNWGTEALEEFMRSMNVRRGGLGLGRYGAGGDCS